MHILGVCGDTYSHIDLIDILFFWTTAPPLVLLIKFKLKNFFEKCRTKVISMKQKK